jgi:hypothetical protein
MSEEAMAPEDTGQADSGESSALAFNASSMPEGLKDEPSLQTFDSVDKLAKSYVNAVKKIGGDPNNMINLPQEGESWDHVYNQLGRPERSDGYDLGEDDQGDLDNFKQFSHDIGLTQHQAENILNAYSDIQEQEAEQFQQNIKDLEVQTTIDLQREWGKNFDGNMDYAKRAYSQFASPELSQVLDNTGLGNHPEMIRAFSKIGQMLGEESLAVGTGLGQSQMSPQAAQEEIQALYSDQDFSKAYRDNRDPGHQTAMRKMDRLFKQAYPNQRRVR